MGLLGFYRFWSKPIVEFGCFGCFWFVWLVLIGLKVGTYVQIIPFPVVGWLVGWLVEERGNCVSLVSSFWVNLSTFLLFSDFGKGSFNYWSEIDLYSSPTHNCFGFNTVNITAL